MSPHIYPSPSACTPTPVLVRFILHPDVPSPAHPPSPHCPPRSAARAPCSTARALDSPVWADIFEVLRSPCEGCERLVASRLEVSRALTCPGRSSRRTRRTARMYVSALPNSPRSFSDASISTSPHNSPLGECRCWCSRWRKNRGWREVFFVREAWARMQGCWSTLRRMATVGGVPGSVCTDRSLELR